MGRIVQKAMRKLSAVVMANCGASEQRMFCSFYGLQNSTYRKASHNRHAYFSDRLATWRKLWEKTSAGIVRVHRPAVVRFGAGHGMTGQIGDSGQASGVAMN